MYKLCGNAQIRSELQKELNFFFFKFIPAGPEKTYRVEDVCLSTTYSIREFHKRRMKRKMTRLSLLLIFLLKLFLRARAGSSDCYTAKPLKIFFAVDMSKSVNGVSYRDFFKNIIDVVLLNTNANQDNEILFYQYNSPDHSALLNSNVWTTGNHDKINAYKSAIDGFNFVESAQTITQMAFRQADIEFEGGQGRFTDLSEPHEEILVLVGDGMPHKQYNMDLRNGCDKWTWNTRPHKGIVHKKNAATNACEALYTMDFTQRNCEKFYGTLAQGGTKLYLGGETYESGAVDFCGKGPYNALGYTNCPNKCKSSKPGYIYRGSEFCSAPNCKGTFVMTTVIATSPPPPRALSHTIISLPFGVFRLLRARSSH